MVLTATTERVEAFRRQALRLLPPGKAHRLQAAGVYDQLLEGLATAFAELEARVNQVLFEADPRTATEMLSDWERVLDIPGPCGELGDTNEQRRFAIVSKLTAQGGASRSYLISVAASAGYTVELEEPRVFEVGRSTCVDRLYTGTWAHVLRVHAAAATPTFFSAGQSGAGEPLVSWSNELLECLLTAIAPAHAQVLFKYDLHPSQYWGPWDVLGPDPVAIEMVVPDMILTQG